MSSLVLAAVVVFSLIGLKFLVNANPADVAVWIRKLSAWVVLAAAGLLAIRGQVLLAAPLMVVGSILLRRFGGLGGQFPGSGARKREGQKSRVRTGVLAMELDHDTGEMEGEVLYGQFAGKVLSSLSLDELMQFRLECEEDGPQTSALMESYLDRYHSDWREREGVDSEAGQKSTTGSSEMSREEALEILGLAYGATREEIRKAHKALMKQFHPDHGGSSYLASKINQAKDLLLQ